MKNIALFLISAVAIAGCSKFDNYEAPNGGISGRVVDEQTGELIPLPVQGSTGVMINLFEQNTNATQSIDFYAKYDGTFENSRIFNNDYRVVVKGPFVEPCEQTVTVNGQTSVEMRATPYARIEASASASGGSVSIQYSVARTSDSYTTSDVYGYWNFAPGVDDGSANYAGKITVKETSGTITFDLANDNNYKNNLQKIRANGNKIYLRVGARTQGVVNYSTIQTVVVN